MLLLVKFIVVNDCVYGRWLVGFGIQVWVNPSIGLGESLGSKNRLRNVLLDIRLVTNLRREGKKSSDEWVS